ncbi:MAG: PQQ-binding-like beta-propeller repeat protein [Pirellulales bacterium]
MPRCSHRRIRTLFLAVLISAPGASARAEDWPGWRGPQRNGVSNEQRLPTHWSPTSGIRWKAPLPGSGISNPIVSGDRVVCTSADGVDQRDLHVICLDRATGVERWHTRLWGTAPTLHHATKSSMASPSPVTDGDNVYAFFGSGDVFCLDMDGRFVWQRSLAEEYGPFENRFAASSSPLLFEDLLVLQCDHYGPSYLLAIDKHSGANRWKVDRPEVWLSWCSPVAIPAANAREPELIVCGSEKMDAFDPRSGEKLWTLSGMARECIPTPIVVDDMIYATSGPGAATYAVRSGGRGVLDASQVAWTNTRGNPYVPSAIVVDGRFYVADDNGIAGCLDARTGKSLWRKRFGGAYTASPVAGDGKIYFTNESGETLVLAAGTDRCEEIARNTIGEPVYASPAISHGCLFLRSSTQLWCMEGAESP